MSDYHPDPEVGPGHIFVGILVTIVIVGSIALAIFG